MPSRLTRRYFDPDRTGSRQRLASLSQQRTIDIDPPWGGFTPSISPMIATYSDAQICLNIVPRGQLLAQDDGFDRIDSARLPLGTNTPPAGAGSEEPVVGIANFREIVAPHNLLQFAITADAVLGHLYELVAGVWTNRAYVGAAAGLTGTSADLIDWTYFPPDDILVFCNGVDPVFQFPNVGGGNQYTDFNTGAFFGGGSPSRFIARSVEHSNDRLVFFNTTESTTPFPNRVRWTTVGGTASLDPTLAGAGFIDLRELNEGLRLESLGNLVACYADNGVAFLRRRQIASEPFEREYLSKRRGLLGPQSVINLGGGVHFGIFDDGWFLLDESGRWQERGIRNIGGKIAFPFKSNFYDGLAWDNRQRVVIGWDEVKRFLRISWPSGTNSDPDQTWVYDLNTDTVWPQNYGQNEPNIYGQMDGSAGATPWSSFGAGDPWVNTGASWESFETQVAQLIPAFGTVGGLVFRYDHSLLARDGIQPNYFWQSYRLPTGSISQIKAPHRLHISYVRLIDSGGNDPPAIGAAILTANNDVTKTLQQTKGANLSHQTVSMSGLIQGLQMGFRLSGTAPALFLSFALEFEFPGRQEFKTLPS